MDKKYETLCELCDAVHQELESMNKKLRASGGKLSANEVEYLNMLTGTMDHIESVLCKMEKKYEEEDMDWGGTSRRRSRTTMPMPSRRNTNNMVRDEYSRDNQREDFKEEVEMLMNRAPDEFTRRKFEKFINEMR